MGCGTTENVTGIFDTLNKLEYKPYTCDGLPEYRLTAMDGTEYAINLSEKWVWRGNNEQAELSDELIAQLDANETIKAYKLLRAEQCYDNSDNPVAEQNYNDGKTNWND